MDWIAGAPPKDGREYLVESDTTAQIYHVVFWSEFLGDFVSNGNCWGCPITRYAVIEEEQKVDSDDEEDVNKCSHENAACRWRTHRVNDNFCPKHIKLFEEYENRQREKS
jgi:hypothetical protein